ncbi:MAG: GGDEF domain-containing protein [Oscillospiraceae bacterium]|nr:GGDEF domain-containing protein [Oscillospiraceae bacterium]
MATAIHVEIDVLFLLILCFIAYQSKNNISQQMSRILFRNTVYGIMLTLALDILWMLIDGRQFPGGRLLNAVVNAVFLSGAEVLGVLWYLYVLETLGHHITKKLFRLMLLSVMFFIALNLLSVKTEWIFYIDDKNVYVRGQYFWVQIVGSLSLLLISLVHILFTLLFQRERTDLAVIRKLLGFYIIPVIGTFAALPFSGMPGTWTCAAVSIILIYMDDQDGEIVRDSLTGLNNRKTLKKVFAEYVKQASPQKLLCLFMIDLDNFKTINDTQGHPTGDQALVAAAKVLTGSLGSLQAFVARYGGDEFLIMGFFPDETEIRAYMQMLEDRCTAFNREKQPPYVLRFSIGSAVYMPDESFEQLVERADSALYEEKRRHKAGR